MYSNSTGGVFSGDGGGGLDLNTSCGYLLVFKARKKMGEELLGGSEEEAALASEQEHRTAKRQEEENRGPATGEMPCC